MIRHCAIAATAAAILVSTASAEQTNLLDIPSGNGTDIEWSSGSGIAAMPFTIESSYMNFRHGGFATEGVVRAWDFDTDTNQKGKIWFDADAGISFSSISFDLSGFKEYASVARFKIKLNGELWKDKTWSFDGNADLIHRDWKIEDQNITSIQIVLENVEGGAWNGLDNINIGTVPAPGALALLGAAGFMSRRRRH